MKKYAHITFIIAIIVVISILTGIGRNLINNSAADELAVAVSDETVSDNEVSSNTTIDDGLVAEEVATSAEDVEIVEEADEPPYINMAGFDYPNDEYETVCIPVFHALEGTWVAEGEETSYFKLYIDEYENYCFEINIDSKHNMPAYISRYMHNDRHGLYKISIHGDNYHGSFDPTISDDERILCFSCWEGTCYSTINYSMVIEQRGRYIKLWNEDETEALYFHPVDSRESLYKSGTPEFVEIFEKLQGVWVMEDGRYFIEFFPKDDIYFFFGMCFAFGKVIDYENFYGDPVVSIYVYDPETDEHAIEGEIHIAVTDSYFYDMGASVREYYIEENGEYIRIADSDFSESVILYPGDSSVVDKWFEEMGYEKWY